VLTLSIAPPLPPHAYVRGRRGPLPFPLDEPGHRIYRRARHGLYQALSALPLVPGDEALVPAYHHGSEIEAVRRAGLTCRFYDCDVTLAPDERRLDELHGPRTRVLYLVHYYGFPQDAARWRTWAADRDLLLVEDAAQSWLSRSGGEPVGSFGDVAIFCLHKSFGLPDGGALIARRPPPPPRGARGSGVSQALRRHREWLGRPPAGEVPDRPAEREFALGDPESRPAGLTTFLLPRVADRSAAARRRANLQYLCDRLGAAVPAAFRPEPGAAPYACLLTTADKPRLLGHLAGHGILGGRLWETPHPLLPGGDFPVASRMRAALVGLPVHQELRPRDLERIAGAVAGALT
jgi:dTDP-4-amino-4,6-dideoxygalactose transaminase